MAGRPQFETVVATAAKERLVVFQQSPNTPILAGASETFNVFANPGTIVKVIAINVSIPAPAGAASGLQSLFLSYTNPAMDIVEGNNAFNQPLTFNDGYFRDAALAKPADVISQIQQMQLIQFDSVKPFAIGYLNGTNVTQNGTRIYRILGIERQVGA